MEQPPRFVAQEESYVCLLRKAIYGPKQNPRAWFQKFSQLVLGNDFRQCVVDHSVSIKSSAADYVFLTVYVDDILLTGSDTTGIAETKEYQSTYFVTKDVGKLKYFFGIEFAYNKDKMALSQRKYVLDLLHETGLLGCKPESTLIEQNSPFWDKSSVLLK